MEIERIIATITANANQYNQTMDSLVPKLNVTTRAMSAITSNFGNQVTLGLSKTLESSFSNFSTVLRQKLLTAVKGLSGPTGDIISSLKKMEAPVLATPFTPFKFNPSWKSTLQGMAGTKNTTPITPIIVPTPPPAPIIIPGALPVVPIKPISKPTSIWDDNTLRKPGIVQPELHGPGPFDPRTFPAPVYNPKTSILETVPKFDMVGRTKRLDRVQEDMLVTPSSKQTDQFRESDLDMFVRRVNNVSAKVPNVQASNRQAAAASFIGGLSQNGGLPFGFVGGGSGVGRGLGGGAVQVPGTRPSSTPMAVTIVGPRPLPVTILASSNPVRYQQALSNYTSMGNRWVPVTGLGGGPGGGPGGGQQSTRPLSGAAAGEGVFSWMERWLQRFALFTVFASLTAGAYKAGEAALQMALDFERSTVAFEVMTGSIETGAKLLQEVNQLALESPFHSSELVKDAKQLKAFGTEASQVTPTLAMLGDVSAATGTDISRIVLANGQVRVAGRMLGTELRQFSDAGIPLMEELAEVMDKPREVIRGMVHDGQVGFPEVQAAFKHMTEEGGRFHDLMTRISKSTPGRWEAFVENIQVSLRNLALSFFEGFGVKDLLGDLIKQSQEFGQNTEGMSKFFEGMRKYADLVSSVTQQVWDFIKVHRVGFSVFATLVSGILGLGAVWVSLRTTATLIKALASPFIGVVGGAVGIAGSVLSTIIHPIKTIKSVAGELYTVLSYAFSPIGIAAIALTAILYLTGTLSKVLGDVKVGFAGFGTALLAGLGNISTAFTSGEFEKGIESALNTATFLFDSFFNFIALGFNRVAGDFLEAVNLAHEGSTDKGAQQIQEMVQSRIRVYHAEERNRALELKYPGLSPDVLKYKDVTAPTGSELRSVTPNADWLNNHTESMRDLRKQIKNPDRDKIGGDWFSEYRKNMTPDQSREYSRMGVPEIKAMIERKVDDQIQVMRGQLDKKQQELIGGFFKETKVPIDSSLGGLLGGAVMPIESERADRLKKLQDIIGDYQEKTGKLRRGEVPASEEPTAVKQLREIAKAAKEAMEAYKDVGKAQNAILNRNVTKDLQISPYARELAENIQKEMRVGTTAIEQFHNQLGLLQEAYEGTYRTIKPGMMALGGAMSGELGRILNLTQQQYGLYKIYQDKVGGLGDQSAKFPVTAYEGTSQAQDIINAAQQMGKDKNDEVVRNLMLLQQIGQQTAQAAERTANELERIGKNNPELLKPLDINKQ